ncbi:MAG: GntR family transcriptional regulator [Saprospiraceae bacterium]|jgi:GntR family transcriptional regulator|nr:GntR family transcriptional regulator [Saprospiraceae bacterium]
MKIDTESKAPLHNQVEKMMRELIEQPVYRNGAFLPKEVDVAEKLGVARNTVRHAISKLVNEGLLVRKKGVGTKVAAGRIPTRLDSWWSFTKEMKAKGIDVVNFELDVQIFPANDEIAAAMHIKAGTKMIRLSRLRGTSDGPSLMSVSWFHPRLKMTGWENFAKPLYQMLEEDCGVLVAVSREEISAISAEKWLAEKLGVEIGAPLLFRQRIVSDTDGRMVEYNKVYYKGDGFTYSIDIAK